MSSRLSSRLVRVTRRRRAAHPGPHAPPNTASTLARDAERLVAGRRRVLEACGREGEGGGDHYAGGMDQLQIFAGGEEDGGESLEDLRWCSPPLLCCSSPPWMRIPYRESLTLSCSDITWQSLSYNALQSRRSLFINFLQAFSTGMHINRSAQIALQTNASGIWGMLRIKLGITLGRDH